MGESFQADTSENSLKWAVILAILIDIPFLLILLFSGSGFSLVSLFMILPFGITGLIIYASYSAGKMDYILEEEELRINFPLSPLRIPYCKIINAGKVDTSLRFRIFGGSLPGAHWGIFTTSNLGKSQVYATRYKGTFILLELRDSEKILISPHQSDAFLEALGDKTIVAPQNLTDIMEPQLDRRLAYSQVAIVGFAWIALVYYIVSIYPNLPEIIPVHFGLNGVPNRYGSKMELIVMILVSALFPSLNTFFALKYGKYNKALSIFLSVTFLMAVGLFALIVNQIIQAI